MRRPMRGAMLFFDGLSNIGVPGVTPFGGRSRSLRLSNPAISPFFSFGSVTNS